MRLFHHSQRIRRKAIWGPKRTFAIFVLLILGFTPQAFAAVQHGNHQHSRQPGKVKPGVAGKKAEHPKLDRDLIDRSNGRRPNDVTSVIVTLQKGAKLPAAFKAFTRGGKLNLINGHVVDLPNRLLKQLAAHPDVFDVHFNRPIHMHNYRTGLTIGSRVVQQSLGLTGAGVGVAIIDSGITPWHDDLTRGPADGNSYPYGDQRVSAFVDFVNGQGLPYDDDGHGTHVAGIIAGNGRDSNGQKAGVAPGASLVSLKVLDGNGVGTIGNIIAALDWVVANKDTYKIRVVNLSVGAGIHESYWTDPLTLAAKIAVDAGIVVVAAAGNMGQNAAGQIQYGAITAPGNAPWVLTVGASSTMGTATRADDTMASYSSRGPTYIDYAAKPDLVAPGTGTVSLAAPGSNLYMNKAAYLLPGLVPTAFTPYLTLSGTSMAAPVVAGTVALMLQANPALTPNGVKAILQYTAQVYPGYNALTQGAGFLNTFGAVTLARFYANGHYGEKIPTQTIWSKHIIWGNHMLKGGVPVPTKNAFATGVTWGAAKTAAGDNIVWGSSCPTAACDNIHWGTAAVATADNIVWGSNAATAYNIVWGSSAANADNIVWGSSAANDNNVVWGSDCGGADCDNIVWGSIDSVDNRVWGSAAAGDNIVWGSAAAGDNIVWGSSAADDNIVWATSADDNTAWGSDSDTEVGDNSLTTTAPTAPVTTDPTAPVTTDPTSSPPTTDPTSSPPTTDPTTSGSLILGGGI